MHKQWTDPAPNRARSRLEVSPEFHEQLTGQRREAIERRSPDSSRVVTPEAPFKKVFDIAVRNWPAAAYFGEARIGSTAATAQQLTCRSGCSEDRIHVVAQDLATQGDGALLAPAAVEHETLGQYLG